MGVLFSVDVHDSALVDALSTRVGDAEERHTVVYDADDAVRARVDGRALTVDVVVRLGVG